MTNTPSLYFRKNARVIRFAHTLNGWLWVSRRYCFVQHKAGNNIPKLCIKYTYTRNTICWKNKWFHPSWKILNNRLVKSSHSHLQDYLNLCHISKIYVWYKNKTRDKNTKKKLTFFFFSLHRSVCIFGGSIARIS